MNDGKDSQLVAVAGLWDKTVDPKDVRLEGHVGIGKLVVRRNENKVDEYDPDYLLMVEGPIVERNVDVLPEAMDGASGPLVQ